MLQFGRAIARPSIEGADDAVATAEFAKFGRAIARPSIEGHR